jgi:large subunit ribosomal protein L21
MKKAVIEAGGKQYLVHEGEIISVELINPETKNITLEPLLVFDENKIDVGTPRLTSVKVSAVIEESDVKDEKVVSIRYKAKKRVHKLHGHRQHKTNIKIVSIK